MIRELWTQASRSASPLEERLQSLKKKINAWSQAKEQVNTRGKRTWASVAA